MIQWVVVEASGPPSVVMSLSFLPDSESPDSISPFTVTLEVAICRDLLHHSLLPMHNEVNTIQAPKLLCRLGRIQNRRRPVVPESWLEMGTNVTSGIPSKQIP